MTEYPEICILTWSANGLRLCESLDDIEVNNNRRGLFRNHWGTCKRPDMFLSVDGLFSATKPPTLVIIGFTDEADKYTYFHSEYLMSYMRSRGYSPIGRDKITLENTCRISVYARTSIAASVKIGKDIKKGSIVGRLPSGIDYKSGGAIGIYLNVPSLGNFAFVLVILEDDPDSLSESWDTGDPIVRKNYLLSRDIIFNNIIKDYILDPKGIDYAFIFGKLNYRMSMFDKSGLQIDTSGFASAMERGTVEYLTYYDELDELKREMDLGNIYNFLEGVNNAGPNFLPTCDRKLGRNKLCKEECFVVDSVRGRVPSWCLRLLYNNYNNDASVNCSAYNRFESGETMTESFDAGVYGIYEIKPVTRQFQRRPAQ